MNCKPGDLAVLIRAEIISNLGLVVEVLGRGYEEDGLGWHWLTKSSHAMPCTRGADSRFAYVPDAWMRPIRDPGDDAQDETLNWLPVPTKEVA